jgi:hypothetical protein
VSLPRNPRRLNVPPYRPPGYSRGMAAPVPPAASVPTPAPRPEPARGVGLVLRIDGTLYDLALAPYDPHSLALRVWTLSKLGGGRASYQVCELPASEGRHSCECADWHYQHEGEGDTGCKHIRAIRTLVDRGELAPLPWALATDLTRDQVDDMNSGWTICPTAEDLDLLPGQLAVIAAEEQIDRAAARQAEILAEFRAKRPGIDRVRSELDEEGGAR